VTAGGSRLAAELVAALDDEALDQLAERLAPRVAAHLADSPTPGSGNQARSWMTVGEVATATRLHPQTVYRHLRSGRLQGDHAGSRWRVAPEALEDYLSTAPPSQRPRPKARSPPRRVADRPGPLRALLDAEGEGG
jgi:excisionase family DNA binding protein